MNTGNAFFKTNTTLRITALWAFCEAFAGGILHATKIPFTGLVLASIASVCITLIALGNDKRGEIIKATLLVIAVKFVLSPHTPPMAYIAVLMQGLMGELLFLNRKFLKPAAFMLTLFSLMYSALQQLIILTVIFGTGFWQAIDIFLNKITQSFTGDAMHYSLFIILFYLACYLLAGILGGFLNIKMINVVQSGNSNQSLLYQFNQLAASAPPAVEQAKNTGRKKWSGIIFGGLMLLVLVCSYLPFFNELFRIAFMPELVIRAVIVVLVWNYFVNPLLRLQLQKWVEKYRQKNSNRLQQVIALLPGIRTVLQQSWQLSHQEKRWPRLKTFINNTVLMITHYEQ